MRPINEERLQKTLDFIHRFQVDEGRTPTYREIKEGCKYSSLGSVSADINRLKERRLIESDSTNGWKSIKLPVNLQSKGSHNTLIVGAVPCGQPSPAIEDYDKYFSKGDENRNPLTEFDSKNTELLNVEQVKEKLLSLQYIRDELNKQKES